VLLLLLPLVQALKNVGMWEAMTEDELNKMMDAVDTNGNGTIEIDGNII